MMFMTDYTVTPLDDMDIMFDIAQATVYCLLLIRYQVTDVCLILLFVPDCGQCHIVPYF